MKTFEKLVARFLVASAVLTMVALSANTATAAGLGSFTSIDYPGAVATFAYGINPSGDVVGAYRDVSQKRHGYVLHNGDFTSIEYPGAAWTEAWGISARGDIVGQYGLPGDNTIHGFLLRGETFTPIDVAGRASTMVVRINPDDTIVGCHHLAGGTPNAVTMYGFAMAGDGSVISHPMERTMNNGINPQGDIVGWYAEPTTGRALWSYLIRDGELTWFQFPGSIITQAWDISPRGSVVGFHRISLTTPFHGFIIERGEMTSFDVEGSTETRAYGISATGDVVGYYVSGGVTHGFLLTHQGSK